MKNSGVTRRIDELGRIVIPKEIRRMLAIRDGETLEILVENSDIILKKYNYLQNISELSDKLIDIYKNIYDHNIIITDREKIIKCSKNEDLNKKNIDLKLIKLIDNRESKVENNIAYNFEDISIEGNFIINPIINETDCIGLVIIFDENNNLSEEEIKISKMISKILSEKLNIS